MSEILVENLFVEYINKKKDNVVAVNNLTTKFLDGQITVILGPSGCGKTTLLRALLGLQLYKGDISLDGVNIYNYSIGERNYAYVSQNIALQPHMTVFDNIAMPLRIRGMDKADVINKVNEIAKELGIDSCLSRKPRHISIGQAQRVALARALVKNASFYFFDEPFSNLDPINRTEERQIVKKIIKEHNSSCIFVTHSVKEATALADRVIVMDEGKIIFDGLPNDLYNFDHVVVKGLVEADD